MNTRHLKAFLWLRWRLRVNQVRKGGTLNAVLLAVAAVVGVAAAVGLFVGGFLVGLLLMPEASPAVVMFAWDGLVVAFLFSWTVGLMSDLQRSEALSLDKFLHLPVSLSGAFLVNYLSSFVSLTLLIFAPMMVGLTLGHAFARPAMFGVFPVLAALVFAVTALTYQFQGWLATLMANPRRRRTVIVVLTAGFILVSQLPNLVNLVLRPWEGSAAAPGPGYVERLRELDQSLKDGRISLEEHQRQTAEAHREYRAAIEQSRRVNWSGAEPTTRLVNLVVPPGWLPLAAAGLAEGNPVPPLFAFLGLTLIGAGSLWRAYRTTLRLYTGQVASGERRKETPAPAGPAKPGMLDWRVPWVSEHAAAVALAGLRSLTRAPEAKMMLITPLILVMVFGSMVATGTASPPQALRPFMAIGGVTMILLTSIQLVGNQFGYDRSGFRAFVLSPAPRRDILLGKNLAVAPLVLGLLLVAVAFVAVLFPMRFDHLIAVLAQTVATYLIFCLIANLLSILAPIPMAPGSFQPKSIRLVPVLMHLGFVFVFPVALVPAVAPLGIEVLFAELGWVRGVPVALALSLLVLAAAAFVYRVGLTWEGDLLAAREQAILEVVTSKAE